MICRPSAVAHALSWRDIVADPRAATDGWPRYRDIVARGESDARADELAGPHTSGCGLVARGYWSQVLARPPAYLLAPYVTGRALADVAEAARHAEAIVGPLDVEPGDVIHVGKSAGGVEHAYIVTSAVGTGSMNEVQVVSVDGGQRVNGWEAIEERRRSLVLAADGTWWDDEVLGPRRPVLACYSLALLAEAFGAAVGFSADA
jgi:hypothetical protein